MLSLVGMEMISTGNTQNYFNGEDRVKIFSTDGQLHSRANSLIMLQFFPP